MDPTMDILHANDHMMAQTHIRLFHRLFYKLSLFYATRVPRKARAIIDKAMLLQVITRNQELNNQSEHVI